MGRRTMIRCGRVATAVLIVAVVSGVPYVAPVAAGADPGPPPGIPAAPPSDRGDDARDARDAAGEGSERTSAWERAVEQADGPHLDQVLEPRPLAAIIGAAWFAVVLRSRWRNRRRAGHAA